MASTERAIPPISIRIPISTTKIANASASSIGRPSRGNRRIATLARFRARLRTMAPARQIRSSCAGRCPEKGTSRRSSYASSAAFETKCRNTASWSGRSNCSPPMCPSIQRTVAASASSPSNFTQTRSPGRGLSTNSTLHPSGEASKTLTRKLCTPDRLTETSAVRDMRSLARVLHESCLARVTALQRQRREYLHIGGMRTSGPKPQGCSSGYSRSCSASIVAVQSARIARVSSR